MEVTLTQVWEKLLEMDSKMATKADLEQVRSQMATKDQLAAVSGDLDRLAQATAKGFAEVNKNISNLNEKVDDVEKNLIEQIEDLARMTNGALAAKQDKFVYA